MICQNNIVGKIIRTHNGPMTDPSGPKRTLQTTSGLFGQDFLKSFGFCGWEFWRFEGEFVILRMCIGLCARSLVGRVRASVQRHINYESVSLQFQEQKIANFLNPRILRQPEAPSLCLYFPSPTASGGGYISFSVGGGLFNF